MSCEIPFSPENSDLVEICEMKRIDVYVLQILELLTKILLYLKSYVFVQHKSQVKYDIWCFCFTFFSLLWLGQKFEKWCYPNLEEFLESLCFLEFCERLKASLWINKLMAWFPALPISKKQQ